MASVSIDASIVIPAYNAARYISECINSVVIQKTNFRYEIIVVDDGSTDGTGKIVQRLHPEVRLLTKKNGGPGDARNAGVTASASEIIVFIDADDRMLPSSLEHQVNFMKMNEEIGLSFGTQIDSLRPEVNRNLVNGTAFSLSTYNRIENAHRKLLTQGNYITTSTTSVRKSSYLSSGGQPTDIRVAEDYAANLAISRSFEIAATAHPYTWYRQGHGGNLMNSPYTHKGLVTVLYRELLAHGSCLSPQEYELACRRWNKYAWNHIRHTWALYGRSRVLKEMAAIDTLLSPFTRKFWLVASYLPPSAGRTGKRILNAMRSLRAA